MTARMSTQPARLSQNFSQTRSFIFLDPLRHSLSLRTRLIHQWLPVSRFRGSLPIGEAPNDSTRDGA